MNDWPINPGLIDYVHTDENTGSPNPFIYANVIANTRLEIDGAAVDAGSLTPDFIESKLHGIGGYPSNIASGFHVIEFLLWGEDLNEKWSRQRRTTMD